MGVGSINNGHLIRDQENAMPVGQDSQVPSTTDFVTTDTSGNQVNATVTLAYPPAGGE